MTPATLAPTAGIAFEVTITALDGDDTLDAAYTGPQCVTFSGPDDAPGNTPPVYPPAGACAAGSSLVFANGLATASLTLVDPETTTLEVTDNSSGVSGTSASITVAEAATTSTATATPTTATPTPTSGTGPRFFSVGPATSAPTAGSAFEVTITALDGADALDAAYTGPQCVTFSGPDDAPSATVPDYPAPADCTTGSSVVFTNGLATVSLTLVDPETTTLEVTDNASGASGASAPITVTGSAVTSTTTTGTATTTTGAGTTSTSTTTTGSTTTTTALAESTTTGSTSTTTTSSTSTTTTSSTSTTAGTTTTTTLTTTPQN